MESSNKKKSYWSWKVSAEDLRNQIDNYNTLKITESYRGISFLIVLVLMAVSLLLSFSGVYANPGSVFLSALIYIPVSYFVYKGHRWAIILLMVLWSLDKISQLYAINNTGGSPIVVLLWWFGVMAYFWKALRVENEKKKHDENNLKVTTS